VRLLSNKSGLRELVGSLTLMSVIAIAPLILPRPATAQSSDFASVPADADSDGAPGMPNDREPDDPAASADMARPAPSADYAVPADVSAGGDPSASADALPPPEMAASHSVASASDDRVLELPQIINPRTYAARAAATNETGLGNDYSAPDQPSDDSLAAADDPADASSEVAPSDPGNVPDEAQDYADQDDGGAPGGPVVVYAAPVYVPQYAPPVGVRVNPLPQPRPATTFPHGQLPMYSALAYRALPMYSGLRPVSPGRYQTGGGGSRLLGSHLGPSFGMRGSVGGFGRGR
jgi:hypothetical protein